jgi:hypothetical protein
LNSVHFWQEIFSELCNLLSCKELRDKFVLSNFSIYLRIGENDFDAMEDWGGKKGGMVPVVSGLRRKKLLIPKSGPITPGWLGKGAADRGFIREK